jgi:dipeptidyl aminopeptidase/acylaminoacyl peptidase
LVTISGLPLEAPNFKGPVLFLAAENDLIFCGFNCTGLFGPTSAAINGTSKGNGGDVETYIIPGFGHGINLHYAARKKAYSVVLNWAGRKI